MDTATLVNAQIEEGRQLIEHLKGHGVDVTVATWVLTSSEALWFLYIASDVVDKHGLTEANRRVYAEFSRCQLLWISRSDLKLISTQDALAVDAIAYRHAHSLCRFSGRKLGDTIIEEAFIYPP